MHRFIFLVLVGGLLGFASPGRSADLPGSRPKVWAIVAGVDRYDDESIRPCEGSGRAALVIAKWLESTAGWRDGAVLRMDDDGDRQHGKPGARNIHLRPTRANLDWAVNEWLQARVGRDDIVLIYFAGQAASWSAAVGEASGRVYLLPTDALGGAIRETGWSLEAALDRAKGLAEKKARVVLWLDTSPKGRGKGMWPQQLVNGGPSGREWLRALTRWPGVTAWLASEDRPAPDESTFAETLVKALGAPERAHNLVGTLRGVLADPAMLRQGFRSLGGVAPGVSLWRGDALIVEQVEPELIPQVGHGDRVKAVLVTADNARMITTGDDSTVRIWSTADRSLDRVLTDPLGGVEALALDRDGTVLIAGDGVGQLTGWDMTLDRPKSFIGPVEHRKGIVDLAYLPEGKLFVSRDLGGKAVLWDAGGRTLRKVGELSDPKNPITLLASANHPAPGAPALVAVPETRDGEPGRLLTFDGRGQPSEKAFEGPGGRITAIGLSDDGQSLVVGDQDGRAVLLKLPDGSVVWRGQLTGAVRFARISKTGALLLSYADSTCLVDPRSGGPPIVLTETIGGPILGEVSRAGFSTDGRWLAICTDIGGRTLLWRLTGMTVIEPVPLVDDEVAGLTPAFSSDGRMLLVGDTLGGLKGWDLDELDHKPRAVRRPSIAPSRGKVATLAPSPKGRFLLEITKGDNLALVWDLEEGRGCKPIPGEWVAGAWLPDESRMILSRRADVQGNGGDVVIFDRTTGKLSPVQFARPSSVAGRPLVNAAFGPLVVSKSGRWVAAATLESQKPLACLWRVDNGGLVQVVREHEAGLTAVDISADEKYWLTASADGSARVWRLDEPSAIEAAILRTPGFRGDRAITAARFSRSDPGRIVTGTRGGDLLLWDWAAGREPRTTDLGRAEGEVNAVEFSSDGRWLAASWALGKTVRFWTTPPGQAPKLMAIEPQPHHAEQVGALAAWPDRPMIVSGGDDSAIKFWDLEKKSLVGTLVAQAHDDRFIDWLAFTPDGFFDGSRPGEAMVKWRVAGQVIALEQLEGQHHSFQLAGKIVRGITPQPEKLESEGPLLKFDDPGDRISAAREVPLTIWSGDANPAALRLYQNGVPVRGEGDFRAGPGPNSRTTTVTLRRGVNQFYVMASKPGAIDGRSDDLSLRYEGPGPPGRVHVLALGISQYERRPLKYAHSDADQISKFLHQRTIDGLSPPGQPGEMIVLADTDVTEAKVGAAFDKIRRAVSKRPEDTVVLFIAGHTDTDVVANQFCLLLPKFPFQPMAAPALELAARGQGGVQARGPAGQGGFRVKANDRDVMAYSILYTRLARLDALQRLVIIDACQAGAILEDEAVRNLQRVVDRGSRQARNSYLLAARRGEPANEADALKHGLLTYTLLRGMGAPGLQPIEAIPGPDSADLDGNKTITTDELATYTEEILPRLAKMFSHLVPRAGVDPSPETGSPEDEQKGKVQSAEVSFPLIAVPR